MKILIVGASGMVGSEAITHCLAHPNISKVVAFVRRELPEEIRKHAKLQSIIHTDFSQWSEDLLRAHSDASAMIWTMGTYAGDVNADLEYPYTFIKSMGALLHAGPPRTPFRYIQLSGKFVRQDQDTNLWWGSKPRKIKGLLETRAIEFANTHSSTWKTYVLKPGGIITRNIFDSGIVSVMTSASAAMGPNWAVKVQELAAFITYLAVDGGDESAITENRRIVMKGRELLNS